MQSSPRWIVMTLAVAVAGTAAYAFHLRTTLERHEIEAQELRRAAERQRAELAALRAQQPRSTNAAVGVDPQVLASRRARHEQALRQRLTEELRLTGKEQAELSRLLDALQQSRSDVVSRVQRGASAPAEVSAELTTARNEILREIRRLLGDERYRKFEDLQRAPVR